MTKNNENNPRWDEKVFFFVKPAKMRNELFPPHASFLYAKRWGFSHAPVVSHFITSRTFVITNYVLRVWKPAPAHQKTSFENEIRKNRVKFAYLTIGKTIRVVNLNVSHMLCEFARSGLIPWQQKRALCCLPSSLLAKFEFFALPPSRKPHTTAEGWALNGAAL